MKTIKSKLTYICSPYRGEVKRNKEYARELTRLALDAGFVPVTVHLYLTEVVDDNNPEERKKGMAAGQEILKRCKYILIGSKYGISEGMEAELKLAQEMGIVPIYSTELEKIKTEGTAEGGNNAGLGQNDRSGKIQRGFQKGCEASGAGTAS